MLRFPEVRGKIGNRRAQPDFRQQNRSSRKRKTVVWSADLGFYPALLESPHGSMRQIPELMSTPPFSRRETAGIGVAASRCARQVLNLPHTSDFRPCGRRAYLYPRLDNGQNSQFRLHTKTPAEAKLLLPALACLLVLFSARAVARFGPYASVGSTPSSLRTSSKAAAMALSMS